MTSVGDGEVTISRSVGVDVTLECDTLVDATAPVPNNDIAQALDGYDVYVVGDAYDGETLKPRNIGEAISQGNTAGRSI